MTTRGRGKCVGWLQALAWFREHWLAARSRSNDIAVLRKERDEAGPMASRHDDAAFECAVADAVAVALDAMTPDLQTAVIDEAAEPIGSKVLALVKELGRAYGSLAALDIVAGRRTATQSLLMLPALPDRWKVTLVIEAGEQDQAVWRSALADVVADPRAAVTLPDTSKPLKAKPPRGGIFGPWKKVKE
jgi:hypothetical protein